MEGLRAMSPEERKILQARTEREIETKGEMVARQLLKEGRMLDARRAAQSQAQEVQKTDPYAAGAAALALATVNAAFDPNSGQIVQEGRSAEAQDGPGMIEHDPYSMRDPKPEWAQ